MAEIPIYKPGPLFKRAWTPSFWRIVVVSILTVLTFLAGRVFEAEMQKRYYDPKQTVLQVESADGKVICYVVAGAISCLPAWMQQKPDSWFVAYPRSTKKDSK